MALKVRAADKPIAGVGTEDPEKYKEVSEFMLQFVYDVKNDAGEVISKGVLDVENKELELEADTKGEAELYAGYARAWGKRQDKPLEIRRIPARQGQPATLIRLSVKTFDPEAPRPGRPAQSAPAPAPAPATPETPKAEGKGK